MGNITEQKSVQLQPLETLLPYVGGMAWSTPELNHSAKVRCGKSLLTLDRKAEREFVFPSIRPTAFFGEKATPESKILPGIVSTVSTGTKRPGIHDKQDASIHTLKCSLPHHSAPARSTHELGAVPSHLQNLPTQGSTSKN